MEIGNHEFPPRSKEKDELLRLYLSLEDWAIKPKADTKQYLPDLAVVPLVAFKNGKRIAVPTDNKPELISVQSLRGDSLFVPPKPGVSDTYLGIKMQPEFIDIPWSFVRKGSYIVLFVPRFFEEKEKGITSYEITVIKCLDDQKLLKLTAPLEASHRHDYNNSNKEKLPMPKFPREGAIYYDYVSPSFCDPEITIKDKGSNMVNIWMGFEEFDSELQKRAVNGTICYRMVEGKVERKKTKEKAPVSRLVPALHGASI